MRAGGLGLPGNVVGIVGAFVGGFLFGLSPVPVEVGLIGAPMTAAVGATVLLFLADRVGPSLRRWRDRLFNP
jgi:uncharacterized membrane protein YeaQ/YmgE (transglycosylase-associated protein family)